jgi:hypothetical protein
MMLIPDLISLDSLFNSMLTPVAGKRIYSHSLGFR